MMFTASSKPADVRVDRRTQDMSAHAIWLAALALWLTVTVIAEVLR